MNHSCSWFHNLLVSPHLMNELPVSQSSPTNPSTHAQLYPSILSVHVPECRHGELLHSFISVLNMKDNTTVEHVNSGYLRKYQ